MLRPISLCGSGIIRVTEATFFSASASMISAMYRAAAESIDSSPRKSARTRNPGATSCNTSPIRFATIFASSAVTFCEALITSRRLDRSSSTAYMLGHHTKRTWSQARHYARVSAATIGEPLHHVLEEGVFECRLKRAGLGIADAKSGTDFELRCAISFNIVPAAFLERCAHRAYGERRRVAIAAEMPEHDALYFSR